MDPSRPVVPRPSPNSHIPSTGRRCPRGRSRAPLLHLVPLALGWSAAAALAQAAGGVALPFSLVDAGPIGAVRSQVYSASWGDWDGDQRPDLALATLFNAPAAVFRNTPEGFVPYLEPPIGDGTASRAATIWLDANRDGLLDLFVANSAAEDDALYLARDSGGFDAEEQPPFVGSAGYGQSALTFDYDRDGLLDLFVPNGGGWLPEANLLLHNLGDGRFARVTSGPVAEEILNSSGATAGDFDGDGWPDLFVSNIWTRNSLFRNLGQGAFEPVLDVPWAGEPRTLGASTGVWADYDNDGDLDLFTPNGDAGNPLYRNEGGRLVRLSLPPLTTSVGLCVGTVFADFDNDGWLDVLIARRTAGQLLFRGLGDGRFEAVTGGPIANRATGANGAAVADYDLDGDLDVLLTNWEDGGTPSLYRNDISGRAWLRIRLEGTDSNPQGIGARIRVRATIGGRSLGQLRQVGGEDAQGSMEPVAHFGLGDATRVEEIRIEWPSGRVQELFDVPVRQVLRVTESAVSELGPPTLNRQTGLFEQRIRLAGGAPQAGVAARVRVLDLPDGVSLANAAGTEGGRPYLLWEDVGPTRPGVTLTATFLQPRRALGLAAPRYEVDYVPIPDPSTPAGERFEVLRTTALDGGRVLVEFASQPGAGYRIEYSGDLAQWNAIPATLVAGGTRTQWIDQGPPETPAPPAGSTGRFYRVVRLDDAPSSTRAAP